MWIHSYIIELKTMKMLIFSTNNVISNSWNVTVLFIKIRDGVFPFTVANSPVDDHVITSDQLPFVCQTIEVTTENEEQVVSSSHSYPLQISPVSSCCGETYCMTHFAPQMHFFNQIDVWWKFRTLICTLYGPFVDHLVLYHNRYVGPPTKININTF